MRAGIIHGMKKILGRNVIETFYRAFGFLSDEKYLRFIYRLRMGKKLNLDDPKTFNEKLQWLKLNDRREIYTTMADKYLVKRYLADKIGDRYVVPLLGVWDGFDDIDFDTLPKRFVLKTNHDSGTATVCRDKAGFDIRSARKKLEKSLKTDYFILKREWPYKNISRKIIAEEYLEEEPGKEIRDYKFFCFNGVPEMMYIIENSAEIHTKVFFDMNGRPLDLEIDDPRTEVTPPVPPCFEEMKKLAARLSEGIPFLRVDFYYVKGRVYVGELTFYHESGLGNIRPSEWNDRLGEMIDISEIRRRR